MRIASICIGWAVATIFLCLSAWSASGKEPKDDGFYSPDDPRTAPWLQRVATGQAGFYGNCDDDHDKRFSPYISWSCKPQSLNAWPPRLTLSTLACDFHRKAERHAWGQGACAPACQTQHTLPGCNHCRPAPSPLSLLRLPPELIPSSLRRDRGVCGCEAGCEEGCEE